MFTASDYSFIVFVPRQSTDWDGLAILKECQKQEWSRQYTPGTLLETHFKEANRKTKDTLGG
jgi:hypothetical protein